MSVLVSLVMVGVLTVVVMVVVGLRMGHRALEGTICQFYCRW